MAGVLLVGESFSLVILLLGEILFVKEALCLMKVLLLDESSIWKESFYLGSHNNIYNNNMIIYTVGLNHFKFFKIRHATFLWDHVLG